MNHEGLLPTTSELRADKSLDKESLSILEFFVKEASTSDDSISTYIYSRAPRTVGRVKLVLIDSDSKAIWHESEEFFLSDGDVHGVDFPIERLPERLLACLFFESHKKGLFVHQLRTFTWQSEPVLEAIHQGRIRGNVEDIVRHLTSGYTQVAPARIFTSATYGDCSAENISREFDPQTEG